MIVTARLYRFACRNCGHDYEAPATIVGHVSLVRSPTGCVGAIHSFLGIFGEVSSLVRRDPRVSSSAAHVQGRLVRAAVAVALDPAPDGSSFEVGGLPPCERCGWGDPDWVATDPPEFVPVDVAQPSHDRWDRLPDEEKAAVIASVIRDGLSS